MAEVKVSKRLTSHVYHLCGFLNLSGSHPANREQEDRDTFQNESAAGEGI